METKNNKCPLRGKPQESSIEPLCFVPAHQSQGQSGGTLSSPGQRDNTKKKGCKHKVLQEKKQHLERSTYRVGKGTHGHQPKEKVQLDYLASLELVFLALLA